MKETKNVPQVRFSGFDDEWEEKKLGEIVTEFKNPVELPHNGYTRLGIRSHAKGTFHEYVAPGHELEAAQMSEVKADSLIMSITFAWEHAVAITDKNDEGKLVSQRFPQFSFNKGQVPKFYKYVIADEKFRHHLWLSSPGGAGRNRVLNIKESMEYKSHIPSSDFEQQKIGAFLSHVDSLIQAKTKKLESLKAVKKSLLQKCFPKEGEKVPEMRFAGFSGDWEEKKLGEIANIYDGTHQTPKYQSTGVKFLSVENIKNLETEKYISTADFVKDFKLYPQKGDILMTRIGDIGTTNIYLSTEPIAFYVSLALLKPTNIDSLFLNYVIQSPFVQNELSLHTLHTAIPKKINKNEISLVKLLVPSSKSEQQKIGQFFSKYDSFISAQQKEIDKLKDIKKSLLQKMFV